jgi:arylsulfatase A-like enzyme
MNAMNLIFITVDGARIDRIIRGKNYKNIIKNSAFFSRVIAYAPYTIGAMHALFSGTYGNKTGVNSYWSSNNFKKDTYKTLAKYLQDEGYVTYGDVINKLVLPSIGFDELIIHDELNDNLTKRHITLLNKFNNISKQGKKFFLYLHYSNIHTGIMQEVLKKHDNFSTEYFANRQKNEQFYDELFDRADEYVGTIMNHIEKLDLQKDTLIVIVSDHGISVGEKFGERAYGVFCYDYTLSASALFNHTNIPTIHVENQVRSIDVLPTILEILQIKTDTKYDLFQGESLIPFIDGKGTQKIAFSQSGNPLKTGKPPKEPNVWSVRTDEWKFIKNIHDGTEELYSLKTDPEEENNVISQFPQKASELRKELDRISSDI